MLKLVEHRFHHHVSSYDSVIRSSLLTEHGLLRGSAGDMDELTKTFASSTFEILLLAFPSSQECNIPGSVLFLRGRGNRLRAMRVAKFLPIEISSTRDRTYCCKDLPFNSAITARPLKPLPSDLRFQRCSLTARGSGAMFLRASLCARDGLQSLTWIGTSYRFSLPSCARAA